jgi:hypothetical protein
MQPQALVAPERGLSLAAPMSVVLRGTVPDDVFLSYAICDRLYADFDRVPLNTPIRKLECRRHMPPRINNVFIKYCFRDEFPIPYDPEGTPGVGGAFGPINPVTGLPGRRHEEGRAYNWWPSGIVSIEGPAPSDVRA